MDVGEHREAASAIPLHDEARRHLLHAASQSAWPGPHQPALALHIDAAVRERPDGDEVDAAANDIAQQMVLNAQQPASYRGIPAELLGSFLLVPETPVVHTLEQLVDLALPLRERPSAKANSGAGQDEASINFWCGYRVDMPDGDRQKLLDVAFRLVGTSTYHFTKGYKNPGAPTFRCDGFVEHCFETIGSSTPPLAHRGGLFEEDAFLRLNPMAVRICLPVRVVQHLGDCYQAGR